MNISKKYEAGDIVGIYKPYVYCLQFDQFEKRCETCFKISSSLLKCTSCHVSRYCDKNCQKALWKLHKYECPFLKEKFYKHKSYPIFQFLIVRLMNRLKIDKTDNPSEIVFERNRFLNDLISHKSEITKDEKKMSDFQNLLTFLAVINLKDIYPIDQIFEFFCKVLINSFSITDDNLNSVGSGLYIAGSIFNHSCLSNAVAINVNNELIIRALRKIKKGEEITISYIEQMQPTNLRKERLSNLYFFDCSCDACLDEKLDQELSLVNCLMDRNTKICQHKQCMEIPNIYDDVKEFNNKQMWENDLNAKLSAYKNLTQKYSAIENQTSWYSFAYHDLAFQLCIELEKWRECVVHGGSMLVVFRKVFKGNHPRLSLHLAKLGKIYSNLDDLPRAIDLLQEGRDMLTLTHGRDNPVTKEAAQLLAEYTYEHLQTAAGNVYK